MSNFSNVVPVVGHGENIKPLHGAWGDPVVKGSANAPGPGIERAGLMSTAPYVDPAEQSKAKLAAERKGKCSAKGNTCQGWARKDSGLCWGHTKQLAKDGHVD